MQSNVTSCVRYDNSSRRPLPPHRPELGVHCGVVRSVVDPHGSKVAVLEATVQRLTDENRGLSIAAAEANIKVRMLEKQGAEAGSATAAEVSRLQTELATAKADHGSKACAVRVRVCVNAWVNACVSADVCVSVVLRVRTCGRTWRGYTRPPSTVTFSTRALSSSLPCTIACLSACFTVAPHTLNKLTLQQYTTPVAHMSSQKT